MKIEDHNTDSAILGEIGKRLTQARLQRNLTQEELAVAAGIAKRTVERLETGHSVQLSNLIRTFRALNLAQNLDQLILPVAPSPIEQLKLHGKERRRASAHKVSLTASGNWAWADNK
jgi:transcriptional regulator with XRE-family HTH domain